MPWARGVAVASRLPQAGPVTSPAPPSLPDWPLAERPGFLIRRLHQIHTALFAERCAAFDVTPVQYSLLSALARRREADQTTLAADVALDRTTATGALVRLAARGLVERIASARDRRARDCRLTPSGALLLAAMEPAARSAHEATLAGLEPRERATLVELMGRLVRMFGSDSEEQA